MPRLSDTNLTEKDPGSGAGDVKAWVNVKDILSIPLTITGLKKKHVEASYFPSGDLNPEHDEFMVFFKFEDEKDAEEVMFGDYEEGATYGFSTNHQRIKAVLDGVDPLQHLPLEGVVILVEERGKYTSYYLGDADTGAPAQAAPAPTQQRQTEERAEQSRGAARGASRPNAGSPPSRRSERASSGGARYMSPETEEVPF